LENSRDGAITRSREKEGKEQKEKDELPIDV
jgi:hypothetical protein